MKKHPALHRMSTLFLAALGALAIGCSSEAAPSVDELAANLCTCEAMSEEMTDDELAQCRTQAGAYLESRSAECLDCLDGRLGDGASSAACTSADACGAACGDDDGGDE